MAFAFYFYLCHIERGNELFIITNVQLAKCDMQMQKEYLHCVEVALNSKQWKFTLANLNNDFNSGLCCHICTLSSNITLKELETFYTQCSSRDEKELQPWDAIPSEAACHHASWWRWEQQNWSHHGKPQWRIIHMVLPHPA